MPVAEVFLGAFLQVLFDRLASRELLEFATRQGIRSGLKKLEENLKMITKVITHADNMLSRETEVDEWLEELRDWAFDADDFLDEVNTRAMQEEEEEEEEEGRRNNTSSSIVTKVRDLGSRFINPGKYSKNVHELNSRLDAISKRRDEMRNLMEMTATDDTSTPSAKSKTLLDAPAEEFDAEVFGREQEKERIIEQLKSGGDSSVEVIAIVGMPGVGKTTLARDVFHSVQLQQQPPPFDIYGWVCVSNDFDVIRITRDILESFNFRASDTSKLNKLQSDLKGVVGGKRFLLVLDDVWTRNYFDDWAPLRSPFRVGAPGSKIIVTTRDNKVASMMQTDDPMRIHYLETLCDDDCWSVFLQHVIDKINPVFELEAERFRVKILDKCKGLPLTAKLLGGLLRGESRGQGWADILSSSIWDLSDDEFPGRKGGRMLPVVMLSYFHLTPHLKRCFSYCSVLPEDYEFGEEEVVLLWMAEGLVLSGSGEQLEVTGGKYFHELVSRSLFQPSSNNQSRFVMHDLINDMAEIVAGKSCFKFDGKLKVTNNNPVQTRYSSYRHFKGLKMEFEAYERMKYLRTFQSFGFCFGRYNFTSYVPLELLMKLKYLRVLRLSGYTVRELPEDIGDLIHLRLVDLSYTYITKLPESTSRLYNLQALKLQGCERLRILPAQMRKLVNLRILDCSGPNKMVAMPVQMGKLTNLQKLSNFIVGKGSEEQGIDQLKSLPHLKESISISFLENVCDSKEAGDAELMRKERLQSVELKWNRDHGDLQGTGLSFRVFAELQPHKHLEKLIVNGYGGLWFPDWVGDDRFSKMTVIELANCQEVRELPPLGKLPVLEEIQITNMAGIMCVGEEFYGKDRGAFPSLKILKFECMENWSIWSYPAGGGCRFACLQELHLINCPKLTGPLPDGISLKKLKVRKCDELLVALPRPSILEMDIGECKVELMERLKEDGGASQLLPSVRRLNIENVDVVEAVESARIISNKDMVVAHPQMMMLGFLTFLEMARIPKLTHFPGVVLQGLPKLAILRIHRCKELTSLWKMDDGGLILQKQKSDFLNSLRDLEVFLCRQLVCLVPQRGGEDGADRDTDISTSSSEEEEEEKQGKQQYLGSPCGLERLMLRYCDKLEKLPSDMHRHTSLRELEIQHCSLTEICFPSTLELLEIVDCVLLKCLSSPSSSLSSSFISMGGNGMPLQHSLKTLFIMNCVNLESLVGTAAFTSVTIGWCPKLKSLPEGIYPPLKELAIKHCENLGELSISVHHLSALEQLQIVNWPAGLLSIQQGGPNSLPPNLRSLHISGGAGGPNDEELFSVPLPSSLTALCIQHFKKLSPESFQNLTSLEELYIEDCPGLTSIPDQLLPPSLRSLRIENCPGLTSIPDQLLLPPSLRSLEIRGCPLLAREFAKDKGRYWPKVKFIPRVDIDRRSIFDPEEEL